MKRFALVVLIAVAAMVGFASAAYADHGVIHDEQCPAPAAGSEPEVCATFYDGYNGESEQMAPVGSKQADSSCAATGVKDLPNGGKVSGVVVSRDSDLPAPSGEGWKDCESAGSKVVTYVFIGLGALLIAVLVLALESRRRIAKNAEEYIQATS